jgi:hypothetical protein
MATPDRAPPKTAKHRLSGGIGLKTVQTSDTVGRMTTDDSVTFYAIHQRFGGGMFTAAEAVREIPSDKLPDVVRGAIVYRDHNGSGDPAKSLGR